MTAAARPQAAIIGLGKMGVSHFAIANASKRLDVVAICEHSALLGSMVEKYCGVPYVTSYDEAIALPGLNAVIIATPTRHHEQMIRAALARNLNVFCEKPLTLSAAASEEFAEEAARRGLVCQVGYHNRFVGTFAEAKRLIEAGAIGRVRHVLAEAYGPVVLKPVAKTWRSQSHEGGGCLYDYAAHPINLANWYVGEPLECSGADLTKQFSAEVEDAVYATLRMPNDVTTQVSVNWSDETVRKMTTKISIWGDGGKIVTDRQELQIYIGDRGNRLPGYEGGWTVRYITDLTPEGDYYLRGEEYSAQIEAFAQAVANRDVKCVNDFASGAQTDRTLEMIRARALAEPVAVAAGALLASSRPRGILARVLGR